MAKFEIPNLENATPEMLVDEMGKLSLVENYVKKMRKVYREALYARLDYKTEEYLNGEQRIHSGETFTASTTRSDPQRIDTEKLKLDYPEIAMECLKEIPQLATRFTLKEGVINPKVADLLAQLKQELDLE